MNLGDMDRPLNERGKRDAPRMGARLKLKGILPDVVISSPAKRALSTAKRISKVIGFPKDRIKTNRELYHANEETILSVVRTINDKHSVGFIFGHNPGLTDFINTLRDDELDIENLPTAGIAVFEIPIDKWEDLHWGTGKLTSFDFPKSKED